MNRHEALSRTALLVQRAVFPDLKGERIIDRLSSLRVRLAADLVSASTVAGQTALVAAMIGISQSGGQVSIDVPAAALAAPQPPLEGDDICDALSRYGREWSQAPPDAKDAVDIAFAFGDASPGPAALAFHVSLDDWGCSLDRAGSHSSVAGEQPFGAVLAGIVIAAEAFRAAMRLLAEQDGARLLPEHDLQAPQRIALALPAMPTSAVDLGRVDIVSAGAITNAAIFTLLRVPQLRARLRVIDDDVLAESNLNRYPLVRPLDLLDPGTKVARLAAFSTDALSIEGECARFCERHLQGLLPLAERVLVGVDHIASRWLVQRYAEGWLGVGGTTDFEAVISEHLPISPCAGCLHPYDDDVEEEIPTVSFVSGAAGTLLAYRLLAAAHGRPVGKPTLVYPFNLAAERAISSIGLSARAGCPVACFASQRQLTDQTATS